MYQNLMIDMAISQSGGQVFADTDWTKAFARAAEHLARIVNVKHA